MIIKYLFSAPKGDIPVCSDDLKRPFLLSPWESHPFLTLGDYFKAIKGFFLNNHKALLTTIFGKKLGIDVNPNTISEMLIRTEKHGAFYHLASIEVFADGRSVKICVSTAISKPAKILLKYEFDLLKLLNSTFACSYLPIPYFQGDIEVCSLKGCESFSMILTEWFEKYCEWHLSLDKETGRQRICIWDLLNGHRFASKDEEFEIFRQCSKILTSYYDIQDFNQIYPWHHAAGDFVVKIEQGIVDVKLTTARKYKPVMVFSPDDDIDPVVALTYFFLNLSIRMRLDRLNGIGKITWADSLSVKALILGFFEGLQGKVVNDRCPFGQIQNLVLFFKTLDPKDLAKFFRPLLDLYANGDGGDFAVIQANFQSHVQQLYEVIQCFEWKNSD